MKRDEKAPENPSPTNAGCMGCCERRNMSCMSSKREFKVETYVKLLKENYFIPTDTMKQRAWVSDEKIYEESVKDPVGFWAELAKEGLDWFKTWDEAYRWQPPYFKWFIGAKVNASYNALDRHMGGWRENKLAIIWEPEPLKEPTVKITYRELYREVNRFANVLKTLGVKKGDRVGIYLPMMPETHVAVLACARIGAPHTVVFSAFSAESLRERLQDSEAKTLITTDGYYRRGKMINLKENADKAVEETIVEKIIVVKRIGEENGLKVNMVPGRDYWWHELRETAEKYCAPEVMDSEDLLYILYTSGTTARPKGVIHETGGYLTQAYWTCKWIFDIHDEDIYWCTSDIGWVTGHTYACYGPLIIGATLLIYEGAPDYPDPGRVWRIIEKNGVTIFYTAPTLIRMLMKLGDEYPKKYDLTSLRLLGTVGEPINYDAWMWYFNMIGQSRCPIVDTWWQTETGGILVSALPGIGPFIPSVAGRSFPGTVHIVLDDDGKPVNQIGGEGYLVQVSPFAPGMLRGLWKAHEKYVDAYWSKFGDKIYFAGDGARVLENGNFRFLGRVDDVMKVAGHRLSTAEMETTLARHPAVAEVAVIAIPQEIKGEAPVAFVIVKQGFTAPDPKELVKIVDTTIGPIARPEKIYFVEDLPKTRSGKIMRRLLRKLSVGEALGDTTTLMNPEVLESIQARIAAERR